MKAQKNFNVPIKKQIVRAPNVVNFRAPAQRIVTGPSPNFEAENKKLSKQLETLSSQLEMERNERESQRILIGNLQGRVKELSNTLADVRKPDLSGIENRISGIEKAVKESPRVIERTIPSETKEMGNARFDVLRDDNGRISAIIQTVGGDQDAV